VADSAKRQEYAAHEHHRLLAGETVPLQELDAFSYAEECGLETGSAAVGRDRGQEQVSGHGVMLFHEIEAAGWARTSRTRSAGQLLARILSSVPGVLKGLSFFSCRRGRFPVSFRSPGIQIVRCEPD
jgi:hypothetical protein